MKYFIPILLSILILLNGLFTSCSDKYGQEELSRVESIIEDKPDSAYIILSDLDKDKLIGKKQKARYALLMSMALDKNYIDTTTFDVLQPAIDYYLKKGTPDEKLKTYYYQGVINLNRGDRDKALDSFVRGLNNASECKDTLIIARTHVALAILYKDFFDIENYTNHFNKAENLYNLIGRENLCVDCMINVLDGYILLGNKVKADSINHVIKQYKTLDKILTQEYRIRELSHAIKFGSDSDILNIIERDSADFSITEINKTLTLANAYNRLNRNEQALNLLNRIKNNKTDYDTLKYLAISVSVFKDLNDFKDAFLTYWDFSHRFDSINQLKFDQQSRSIKEKYILEINSQMDTSKKNQIIWGCLGSMVILILILIILSLITRSNKIQKELAIKNEKAKVLENEKLKAEGKNLVLEKNRLILENKNLELERDNRILETENLAHKIQTLEDERDNLKSLLDSKDELPDEVRQIVKEREEMLNLLLASHITENSQYEKAYYKCVSQLTENTEDFMNTNRLAFQASHPKFIQYFEDHNLTKGEINYVCLYALGLRGKEVGSYMKMRSHVNISSAIRKKLGIDKHETNLGIYVRKLLKSL